MPQPGVGDNAPLRPVGGGAPHQGRSHAPPQRHQVAVGRPMPGPRRGTNVGGQAAQARLGGRHVEVLRDGCTVWVLQHCSTLVIQAIKDIYLSMYIKIKTQLRMIEI